MLSSLIAFVGLALFPDSAAPPPEAYVQPKALAALPSAVREALSARGCLVPRSTKAGRSPAAVSGAFYQPGPTTDWAVFCSRPVKGGRMSVLFVFGAARNFAADSVAVAWPEHDKATTYSESSATESGISVELALGRTTRADIDELWKPAAKSDKTPLTSKERRLPRHDGILDGYDHTATVYWTGNRWVIFESSFPC